MILRCLAFLVALGLIPALASGHEVRPALLRIVEQPNHRYDFSWKRPVVGQYAVRLIPHISGHLLERAPDKADNTLSFQLDEWQNVDAGPNGLDGRTLWIEGLDSTITTVLVSVQSGRGHDIELILTPRHPSVRINLAEPNGIAIPGYLILGITHILTGLDHLSFVLGLVLLVSSRSMLLKTITAFTLAHSITLALTALQIITVRPALIEALVALSILFVAVELIQVGHGRHPLMARFPWAIALVFGLLHGSAFAGGLAEVGLPPSAVPLSLFLFNLGVEIGQLLFVGAVLTVSTALSRLPEPLPNWVRLIPSYAIGSTSAFWLIDRIHIALN